MLKIESSRIAKLTIFCYLLLITGCASSLKIQVLDSDNKMPVNDVEVSVKADGMRLPIKYRSDETGTISYPEIKSLPAHIVLTKDGEYFSIDTTISAGSLKDTILIYMDELMTIVSGEVLDTAFVPIAGVIVSTETNTIEVITDEMGRYTLKSKLFLNTKYDIIAEHNDYEINQLNNIPISVNEKNLIEPIEMKKKIIVRGPGLEGDIEGTDPSAGDDEIWIDK